MTHKRKPATKPATEREAFEKWVCRALSVRLDRDDWTDGYLDMRTHITWLAWQARARLARREGK